MFTLQCLNSCAFEEGLAKLLDDLSDFVRNDTVDFV